MPDSYIAHPHTLLLHMRRSLVLQEGVVPDHHDTFEDLDGVVVDDDAHVWVAIIIEVLQERLCGFMQFLCKFILDCLIGHVCKGKV